MLIETTKNFVRDFFWTRVRPVGPPGGYLEYVGLFVGSHISETVRPYVADVARGRDSVLLYRRCDFVDDVT